MSRMPVMMLLMILISCDDIDNDIVRSYFDNGNINSELRYKDGMLNGECVWYYSNGKKRMSSHYDMNVQDGETVAWYENGNIQSRYYTKDGEYDSIFESYNVNGKLVKSEFYKNGVKHGQVRQWYDNGNVFVEGQYHEGMFDGRWTIYYENGSLGSVADYTEGEGCQVGYSPEGIKVALIHYSDNVKDGEEIHYNRDGSVKEILVWSKGDYIGKK